MMNKPLFNEVAVKSV